ncbi:DUF1310 domain-containing protein [Streptococcus parasuis]|uniref:DUF1310 family protein n=1 Tax=Streptococcus parasuis TaxID=1501662 RepID=UPI0015569524|nr:DUF1310 family protein [Streptococcus parasuis]NQM14669.1 DUF1310 family protein [Streptococcus suis]QWV86607.1 DUF1310 domain-containing protein [Streptococcus parasuis]
MKTWQKWLAGILASITILIGLGVMYQMNKQTQLKEEMIKIVESDEVTQLFEAELKSLDSKALTDEGKIKTYSVDYDSFNKNPMGGFSVNLYVNDNKNLRYTIGIDKDNRTQELYSDGGGISTELQKLLGR